jgi:hypothetical protein
MVASDISDEYRFNERRDQRFLIRVQRRDQADRLVMWDGLSREILLADDVEEEYFEHVREMEEGEEDSDIESLRQSVGIVFLHRWCIPLEEVRHLMGVKDAANLQYVTDFRKKLRKCELFYKLRMIMPLHHFVVFVVGQGGLGDLGNCNDRNQRLQLWGKEIDNERKLHRFHYW